MVLNKQENVKYIAKKVILSGLKQKEKEAAILEVNLLKNLWHLFQIESLNIEISWPSTKFFIIVIFNCSLQRYK